MTERTAVELAAQLLRFVGWTCIPPVDPSDVERAIDLETRPKRGKVIRLKHITREMVRADTNTVFVFGDNMARRGLGGQAAAMRGEPNTIGVPTKRSPTRDTLAHFTDADADDKRVKGAIIFAFAKMREALESGRNVVIPADGLGTGLADRPRRAPRIYRAIEERIAALEAMGRGVLRDAAVHMIVTTDAKTYIFYRQGVIGRAVSA